MSLVVTGTDTEVGKTLVSAVLLARYAELAPAYWKPIATGGSEGSDSRTVAALAPPDTRILPEVYRYQAPVSPHLAARLENEPIQREMLLEAFEARQESGPVVIEGIGGLLVPLDDRGWLLADLLGELGLPVVLVASTRVGTINHTLLSLEAARRRQLSIAGVVLSGPADPTDNHDAIERFGAVDVIDVIPPLEVISAASVAAVSMGFDSADRLRGPLLEKPAAASR